MLGQSAGNSPSKWMSLSNYVNQVNINTSSTTVQNCCPRFFNTCWDFGFCFPPPFSVYLAILLIPIPSVMLEKAKKVSTQLNVKHLLQNLWTPVVTLWKLYSPPPNQNKKNKVFICINQQQIQKERPKRISDSWMNRQKMTVYIVICEMVMEQ